MVHAKEAREHLEVADSDFGDTLRQHSALTLAAIGIGHALLALEGPLTAIAAGVNSPDNLGSQFGAELLERLDAIAGELETSRTNTGDRIREELADLRLVIERSTRQ